MIKATINNKIIMAPEGSTILEAAEAPAGTPLRWLLEGVRKLFLATYLKTYLQLCPDIQESLAGWQSVMAANYLDTFITGA